MKAILTLTDSPKVKAGVEIYNSYLKRIFPSTKIFAADAVSMPKFPLLKEPLMAKNLCKSFAKSIEKERPEIIFTQAMYGWALKTGVPVINIQHGTYKAFAEAALPKMSLNYFRTNYIYPHYEKLAAERATVVVANSEFTKSNLEKYYGIKNVKVILNCVDTDTIKPIDRATARRKVGLPVDKKIVLFVGRPDYTKGFDIVEKVAEQNKDISFVYVLNPPVASRSKNVLVRDAVDHTLLKYYYSAADFVIFPSRFEGFGYVPLEALACNTQVVSSKVGIVSGLKIDGLHTVENTQEAFSEKIRSMDFEKTDARLSIEEKFSFERFAKEWRELVDKIVGKY